MVSWILSRAILLVFGTLYPAYYSYKAVKTKNVKEYVRWMMYWIVFALYIVVETVTDFSLSWFPLYYEVKITFVIWLLSPYTRGASLIYRKFLHPLLSSKEREIDDYIIQAKERSYETVVNFGKHGLTVAATVAVSAAVKGQGAIADRLRGFSVYDLTRIPGDDDTNRAYLRFSVSDDKDKHHGAEKPEHFAYKPGERPDEDSETFVSEEEALTQRSLRRSQSVKSTRPKVLKEPRYASLKMRTKRRPALNSVMKHENLKLGPDY